MSPEELAGAVRGGRAPRRPVGRRPVTDDEQLLAERSAAVVRHLDRVAAHLPADPDAGTIDAGLADRLARAAGFRNLLVHAYATLDLRRVHALARQGPADLRAFLVALQG